MKRNLVQRCLAFGTTLCIASGLLLAQLPMTASAGQQLGQTDFEDGVGLPWHVCESAPGKMEFEIANGVYSIKIVNPGGASKGGEDRWDCQFRHRGLKIVSGCTYNVSFEITASNACSYYTKIGDQGEPYAEDWHGEPDSSQHGSFWDVKQLQAGQKQTVTGSFTANRTAEVEWAFHIGGDSVPAGTVFTFDNMSLMCSSSENDYVATEAWVRSDILTNQVGYFADMQKKATLLSDQSDGVGFSLKDSSGKEVYSGTSEPMGKDADSGDDVHVLDFSDFTTAGTYTLEAETGAKSREFKIGGGELYSYLLYDSLNYFYQNRSGIEIDSKYIISGDAKSLARAAGHATDMAKVQQDWGYSGSGTQDVSGGWYDAGDHGKYVVNGGISLWLMQNQYEHAVKTGDISVYGDGSMSIPENSNKYPDLLDEARYEMEFFLKMVVKDGDCAGMVYHKVHDIKWTALALAPADDTEERILKPPTTAATLNAAACGAQAYRLWKDLDKDFAAQCLDMAKQAYTAAKAHPEMYAPLDESVGGGPYGDDNVTDEFYWAATELYLATGDSSYASDMEGSDYYLQVPTSIGKGENVDTVGSFDWGNVATLGSLSLALNTDILSEGDADKLKASFTQAGEYFTKLSTQQGYGQPYGPSAISYQISEKGYVWGSNSFVADNAIVCAYAYDLNEDKNALGTVVSAMDYLLGRNPMDYSYVTGYGTHAAKNPHHRWWSHQVDESFPAAPNGVLVGGPNSGLQDPWVKGSGWGVGEMAPAKCYMDHVEAWSVNECTINWNTPLAWLSAYLAQTAGGITVTHGSASADANTGNNTDSNDAAGVQPNATSKPDSKPVAASSESKSGSHDKQVLIIVVAVLAALVSIEVFVYKMMKMKRQPAAPAPTAVPVPQQTTQTPNPENPQQPPQK